MPIPRTCPNCGELTVYDGTFCPNCGHSLAPPPPQEAPMASVTEPSYAFQNWTAVKVAILLLVVLIAGVVTGYGITAAQHSANQPSPGTQNAIVSGSVKTTGANTAPSLLVFTDIQGRQWITFANGGFGLPNPNFQGTVQGYFNPSRYSLTLPNHANYTVNVVWVGYFGWQGGYVSKGSVRVDVPDVVGTPNTYSLDFTADTPDSFVGVSGTVSTGQIAPGATPLNVTFLSERLGAVGYYGPRPVSDRGGRFTAQVYPNNQYSLNVPNDERYDIAVQWKDSNGNIGTCYVATIIGIGVVTINVNVGNGGAYYSYNVICDM